MVKYVNLTSFLFNGLSKIQDKCYLFKYVRFSKKIKKNMPSIFLFNNHFVVEYY